MLHDYESLHKTTVRADKLYGIGRADLKPGLRAAQLGHALIHWVIRNGAPGDNLVLLQVRNEDALLDLL